MRKPIAIAITLLALVLLGTSVVFYQKVQTLTSNNGQLKAAQDAADSRYGEALTAIGEIQDSLSALGVGEATNPTLPGSPEAEHGLSLLRGREALDRIALLKAGIQRTKQRIEQLESTVHHNGVKMAGLERLITNLKNSLGEKEALIAQLSGQVDSLHTQVGGLTAQVQQDQSTMADQKQTIDTQRTEMSTVYYVVGSRSDLVKNGTIVSKGGLLGLGTTLTPSGQVPASVFTPIDTDHENVIHIAAPKARVLSAQPSASYSLVPVGKEVELRILDAQAFRTVKHVVIQTMS